MEWATKEAALRAPHVAAGMPIELRLDIGLQKIKTVTR
jgi:hypothetical protein